MGRSVAYSKGGESRKPFVRMRSRYNRSALRNPRAQNFVPQQLQDKLNQEITHWIDSSGDSSSMMWIRGSETTDDLRSAACEKIVNSYNDIQTNQTSKGNPSKNSGVILTRFFVPEIPNTAERDFVPTLTSQLMDACPEIKKLVERQITLHPHIFYESPAAQMDMLFMQPLQWLSHSRPFTRLFSRRRKQSHVIVVDGLHLLGDGDPEVQAGVLQLFSNAVAASKKPTIPLRVLVTSRAEPQLLSAINQHSRVSVIDLQ